MPGSLAGWVSPGPDWVPSPLPSGEQWVYDSSAGWYVSPAVNPVPEPSTYIAGALLLLPFGASTLRMLRKKHIKGSVNEIDSAEEPLWSKSDSEKDHLRCIPRQFKSRTDEASA